MCHALGLMIVLSLIVGFDKDYVRLIDIALVDWMALLIITAVRKFYAEVRQ
jgi:hypothetical protein